MDAGVVITAVLGPFSSANNVVRTWEEDAHLILTTKVRDVSVLDEPRLFARPLPTPYPSSDDRQQALVNLFSRRHVFCPGLGLIGWQLDRKSGEEEIELP